MKNNSPLIGLRRRLAHLPPPVIIYNKSHSGSRLLANTLLAQGIFFGSELNESMDSLPVLKVVEEVVNNYYPDFSQLWKLSDDAQAKLVAVTETAFEDHLAGYDPSQGRRWGWKLCETAYALPFFDFLFPQAKVVHLIRDGRDVAWCPHVAPELSFWRKIYFNTDRIQRWQGLSLLNKAYEEKPHIYNAMHWANSVTIGRAYGTMLRDRYAEIRYEDMCADYGESVSRLMAYLRMDVSASGIAKIAPHVHSDSIGKHKIKPKHAQRAVIRLIEPVLTSFGYEGSAEHSRISRLLPPW